MLDLGLVLTANYGGGTLTTFSLTSQASITLFDEILRHIEICNSVISRLQHNPQKLCTVDGGHNAFLFPES